MIVSNIIGGLGNQMFQFACGYAAALRSKQEYMICTDQFEHYRVHAFQLKRIFDIKTQVINQRQLLNLIGWRSHPFLRPLIAKTELSLLTPNKWFQETDLRYCEAIKSLESDCYLHGYWQSEKYFDDYADEIKKVLSFSHKIDDKNLQILSAIRNGSSISVHVRRGDYLHKSNKILNCLDLGYYLEGLKILTGKIPDSKIFIFSDDTDWVRTNLIQHVPNAQIITHNTGENSHLDMMLMRSASHNIIANSSFSWWGAWLNPNKDKIVISPKNWFRGPTNKCADLIPDDWLRI